MNTPTSRSPVGPGAAAPARAPRTPVRAAGSGVPRSCWATTGALGVVGTGHALPERRVGNDELGVLLGVGAPWLDARTRIVERRWARPGESTADLATHASQRALRAAAVGPYDLGAVVVAALPRDGERPAAQVRERIGARVAVALDVGTADFVSALAVAHGLLGDTGGHALVVGAQVQPADPFDALGAAHTGHGAGAVVLGAVPAPRGLLAVDLSGGAAVPDQLLDTAGVGDVDVGHVVGGAPVDSPAMVPRLPAAKVHDLSTHLGDTGAATVPLTLALAPSLHPGELVLLVGHDDRSLSLAVLTW